MKVVFHKDFYQVYTSEPAAEAGRMEAIALLALRGEGLISTALVLDIDLHFGDGTVNIHNPSERSREEYVRQVGHILSGVQVDLIGISAGRRMID